MKKEFRTLSALIIGGLAFQSCRPFENPKNVQAAPFIPQPTSLPEMPTATPTMIHVSPTAIETPDIPYFSQFNYQGEYFKNNVPWSEAACGIISGAMITNTEPLKYYKRFLDYLAYKGLDGSERITANGSYIDDQIMVMESMGYRFLELPTENRSEAEIKSDIKRFTEQGFPILVGATIWTGDVSQPHITVAVGVNADNEIIWNDPAYGEQYIYALPRKISPKRYLVAFPPTQ
jgi:hypothetical protein